VVQADHVGPHAFLFGAVPGSIGKDGQLHIGSPLTPGHFGKGTAAEHP
jgi:hypothetical protein